MSRLVTSCCSCFCAAHVHGAACGSYGGRERYCVILPGPHVTAGQTGILARASLVGSSWQAVVFVQHCAGTDVST